MNLSGSTPIASPTTSATARGRCRSASRPWCSRGSTAPSRGRHGLEEFKINEAAQGLYRFFWNELCDWYIELAKPTLYSDSNEAEVATRSA